MTSVAVLVADKDAEVTIRTLFTERYQSLGLPLLVENNDFKIIKHPNRDPGVFSDGPQLAATLKTQFSHLLVILDQEWDGSPGNAQNIKEKLAARWIGTGMIDT